MQCCFREYFHLREIPGNGAIFILINRYRTWKYFNDIDIDLASYLCLEAVSKIKVKVFSDYSKDLILAVMFAYTSVYTRSVYRLMQAQFSHGYIGNHNFIEYFKLKL